jgi:competence protein ComEC
MRATPLVAFVAGVFLLQLQSALPGRTLMAILSATAVLSLVLAWRLEKGGTVRPFMVLSIQTGAAVMLGFFWATLIANLRLNDELSFADEGKDIRIIGVVSSLPAQLERGTRFEFDVERVETLGVHVPAHVSLAWYGTDMTVKPAERWQFTVRLKRPHGVLNPGGFDFEAWMIERGLRASGYVREADAMAPPRRLESAAWDISALIDRARHELRDRLQQRLQGARYGGVLVALVLGDQRAIHEEDWALFNRTGISHLVSISGLHITMIAGLAALAISAGWRRSRRLLALAPAQSAAALAAMLAALAYCLLAGWGVPAQRTFFMLATVAIALLLRWQARAFTTLAIAAAVVCLLDPWAAIAPGFWLSFGAVAAIFHVVTGRPGVATGWRTRLRQAVRVQAAVTLALVPLTVVLFQQLSIVSPLANAVAIPLVSLVVTPLALLGGLFVVLPEPIAAIAVPCLAFAHWLLDMLATALQWSVTFRWASIAIAAPPWWTLCLALPAVFWLLAPPGWPMRWIAVVWFVPMFVWPPSRPAPGELWVTAIDIGQGMSMLVETQDHVLLYDTGPRYSAEADAGARVIAPYLRWRGVDHLDLLVVSHLDSDHSGGTASLLKSLPIDRVWTSIRADHPMLTEVKSLQRCMDGQTLILGSMELRVLRPLANDFDRPAMSTNAMSCVLEVRLGPQRVLLTGDLPAREEAELIGRYQSRGASLVTAPHHGSRSSSSMPFVEATRPMWVVYQTGYRNRFGHPADEVVARYAAVGTRSVRTDHAGATQWRLRDDGSIAVESMRTRSRYWHNRPGRSEVTGEASEEIPAYQAEPQVEPLQPY